MGPASFVGHTEKSEEPVTCDGLRVPRAVGALIEDAVKPIIMPTVGGPTILVHLGPLSNIAYGNS